MGLLKKIPLKSWVIFASLILVFVLSWLKVFNNYELMTYDFRLKIRPPLKASPEIILIEISDDTLSSLGKWPLPRDFHAGLLQVLKEKGVRMAVFDLIFAEPTMFDEALAEAARESGNAYMALVFAEPGKSGRLPPESSAILNNLCEPLKESSSGIGHINALVDPDGKSRRVYPFIKYDGLLYPQLAVKVACDRLGLDAGNVAYKGNNIIIDGRLSLPIMPDGSLLVNYPDTWERSFRHLSYVVIIRAFTEEKQGIKPELDLSILKDKVCFIGLTATGTSDIRASPIENMYPMMGLQASIFNSIVDKKFITPAPASLNALASLFVLLLSLFFCLRFSPLMALAASSIIGIAYFLIATVLFITCRFWIDLFLPLSVIILTYIATTAYRFFNETKKRQLLEKELYIARAIQKSFLPQDIKELSGISISSFMQPAKFVAGDLYDILLLKDNKVGVFIGDVSGKGVPASLIMAQTISLFRVFANQYDDPNEVLNRLNKELYGKFEGRFVTCLYMIIDKRQDKVQVSSAGHSPVLLYRKEDNAVSEVELGAGMPLGVMDEMEYGNVVFSLSRNDKVMVFTDGLSEARNVEGEEFGYDKAKKIIFDHGNASSDKILNITKDELFRFSFRAPQHDDITIIVLANAKED